MEPKWWPVEPHHKSLTENHVFDTACVKECGRKMNWNNQSIDSQFLSSLIFVNG